MEQSHSHSNMVSNYKTLASIIKPELLLERSSITLSYSLELVFLSFKLWIFKTCIKMKKRKKFVISFILIYFYLICFIFLWMSVTGWAVSPVSGTWLKTKSLSQNSKVLSELKDPLDLFMLGFFLFFFKFLFFFFKRLFIYLFLLCWFFVATGGRSLVAVSEGYSSLWCTGFSLQRLLLLQSMALGTRASVAIAYGLGSRVVQTLGRLGFSSCDSWALEGWLWHTGLAAPRHV